jgi:hypothetical protein
VVPVAGRSSSSSSKSSVKALRGALKIDIENEKLQEYNPQSSTGTMHNPQSPQVKHVEMKEITDITKSPYVPVYKHNYANSLKSSTITTTPTTTSTSRRRQSESNASEQNDMIVSCSHNDSIVDIVACCVDQAENCTEKNSRSCSGSNRKQFEINIENVSTEDTGNTSDDIEYTDNDLDEALAENDGDADGGILILSHKLDSKDKVNEADGDDEDEPMTPINGSISFDISEGHYLPMTPKKAIISSSASETSILAMDILNSIRSSATDAIEENPYIEMSSGNEKQQLLQQHSPYELVMVTGKKDSHEPLYMELAAQNSHQAMQKGSSKKSSPEHKSNALSSSSAKKHRLCDKNQSRIKKRHDLPDILKQSQQNYVKSDSSSDADDEDVSKEPMALKSRTRFSLSDTFRPASYYLGASTSSSIHKNIPLAECIDSSDSEIVPPPPIPSTSPPDTKDIFSSENFNTIKRNSTTSNNEIIHHRTMSAGSSNQLSEQMLDHNRASRFSLQDQLLKQQQQQQSAAYLNAIQPQFEKLKNSKLFSTASNCSINTDDGSNTSSDFDLYNKIKLQSPSISADSLNQSILTDSSPRPPPILSDDDALFKFEEQNANDKLDQYLNKLEASDLFYSKEQTTWLTNNLKSVGEGGGGGGVGQLDPMALHYENINLLEQQNNQHQKSLYYDSLEDVSNKNSENARQGYVAWAGNQNLGSNKSLNSATYKLTPPEVVHKKSQSFPWMGENSSNAIEQEVQPLREKNLSIHDALHQSTSEPMMIEQDASSTVFEMTQPSHSRNNSNLSDSAPYYYSDLGSEALEKLNNQRDLAKKNSTYISHIHNVINKQQLTSILKDQAEKEQGIDSRNIYEQGSGRLQKLINKDESNSLLSTTDFANNKIYYHEKNVNVDAAAAAAVGSIDNLLYSKSENLDTSKNVECDQLWEEDAIWRESLRRVSQRHARSLDDLDRIESVTKARISDADRQWGVMTTSSSSKSRVKISREVTYVNDDYQRSLPRKKKNFATPPSTSSKLDENDVYVQLAPSATSPSEVYEILRDDSNIDRENIRQWDMMSSSGLDKCARNQHQMFVGPSSKPLLPSPSCSSSTSTIDKNGTLPPSIMKSTNRNGN